MPCVSALYVCLICVPYMCALYVKVAELFGSQTFRVFTSRDVVGVEIGGAVKNVIAIACGVGPSLKVLQKRAMDVTKLLLPYEPTEVLAELAAHKAANPDFNIEQVHFFPLGGIKTNATWATDNGGASGVPANALANQA